MKVGIFQWGLRGIQVSLLILLRGMLKVDFLIILIISLLVEENNNFCIEDVFEIEEKLGKKFVINDTK